MPDNRLSIPALLVALAFGIGHSVAQERTIPGPESDKLAAATTGYVLVDVPQDGITAFRLPTLQTTVVRPAVALNPNDMPSIHVLSGPDSEGRIAYLEDHFFVSDEKQRRHLLKTIRLDGTQDTELFSRPGDAMWAKSPAGKGEVGANLALSPRQGQVAFLSELVPVQMPSAYLHEGSLEVWDVEKRAGSKIGVKALDNGLAWFPDGKRLAYVKFVEPDALGGQNRDAGTFGKSFRRWNKVPVVFVRDVTAGTESQLHLGWWPIVAFDGRTVLVHDSAGACQRVDVATGKSTAVTWPGVVGSGAVANPAPDIVLSWCLPTKGSPIKYTENNSPIRGPKQMLAIKLARMNGDEFQTVVQHVDPRWRVSFGTIHNKGAD